MKRTKLGKASMVLIILVLGLGLSSARAEEGYMEAQSAPPGFNKGEKVPPRPSREPVLLGEGPVPFFCAISFHLLFLMCVMIFNSRSPLQIPI